MNVIKSRHLFLKKKILLRRQNNDNSTPVLQPVNFFFYWKFLVTCFLMDLLSTWPFRKFGGKICEANDEVVHFFQFVAHLNHTVTWIHKKKWNEVKDFFNLARKLGKLPRYISIFVMLLIEKKIILYFFPFSKLYVCDPLALKPSIFAGMKFVMAVPKLLLFRVTLSLSLSQLPSCSSLIFLSAKKDSFVNYYQNFFTHLLDCLSEFGCNKK